MNDDERAILERLDRLQAELLKENWRRDARMAIINRRILSLGGWLLLAAFCAIGLGIGFAIKHTANALDIAGYVTLAILAGAVLHGAAKAFFRDQLEEDDRRAENAERIKDGLDPIRDATFLETMGGFLLLLIFLCLILGILGGIGAVVADLLFLSKTFGHMAQLGTAAFVAGILGFGLISSIGERVASWKARRKASRDTIKSKPVP